MTWERMFMEIAEVCSKRSKDPNTKVGAVIVKENKIISTGYNGMPYTYAGSNDNYYPWTKSSDKKECKLSYVVHAELNAILNSTQLVRGSELYVTHFPCNECAKAIVQSGIKKVVYKTKENREYNAISEKILDGAGITVVQYQNEDK